MNNVFSGEMSSPYTWLFLFLILFVGFLTFSNTLSADFLFNWDDNINITNNIHIHDLSLAGINKLFSPASHIDEPRLTLLTYALEYHFFSLNPYYYHLDNLILHLLNIILVFLFANKILRKGNLSLLVALLFAIHPMHIEPVAWITGRKDLLFSFFYLLSVLCYIRQIESKKRIFWLIGAFVFAYLGVLSKIQALSIPLTWIAIDFYFKRPFKPSVIAEKLVLGVFLLYDYFSIPQIVFVFVIYFISCIKPKIIKTRIAIKAGMWLKRKFGKIGFPIWIMCMAVILILVFRKINMWDKEIADSVVWFLTIMETCIVLFAYIFFVYGNIVFFKGYKSKRVKIIVVVTAIVFVIIGAIFVTPVLHYWTPDFKLDFSIFDRVVMAGYSLTYYLLNVFYPFDHSPIQPYPSDDKLFPLIYYISAAFIFAGSIVVFVLYIYKKIRFNRAGLFGFVFFLINLLMVLHLISIEGRVIVADRYAYLAYCGMFIGIIALVNQLLNGASKKFKVMVLSFSILGIIVFSVYSYTRNRVWKNGIVFFTEVISHYPNYELAYINRGTLYLNRQQNNEAIADFSRAISLKDKYEIPYYNRALAYYNLGDISRSYEDCNSTIKRNPIFFDAWYMRGFIKNKWGNYPGALADYNQTIRLKPDHKLAWYNRGNTKKNMLDYKGALEDYKMTLNLDSGFTMAYNAIGVTLYFLEDFQASIPYYNVAIKKNPGEGNYFFNRGLSELKLKLTEEACNDFNASWGLGYSDSKNLLDQNCK